MKSKTWHESSWSAFGAAIGRAFGLAGKIVAGLVVWVSLLYFAFPASKPSAASPATALTTLPSATQTAPVASEIEASK